MLHYMQRIVNRRDNERGASAVEYGLLVAAIAAIIILLVFALGTWVKGAFKDTCAGLEGGNASLDAAADCPA